MARMTVQTIMLPVTEFPTLFQTSSVRMAIERLRSFCPLGASAPCGFTELMVIDEQGRFLGRVTQQSILKVLFSSLLRAADETPFAGRLPEHSDLATLLDGVLLQEGMYHLDSPLTAVIEREVRPLSITTDLLQAMAVMVLGQETVLPVEDDGKLVGIVKLAEIFGAIGDQLTSGN